MANLEHLLKLEEDVEAWNAWHIECPHVLPDLRGADLSCAELRGALLSNADLSSADLSGADLRGAELVDANLSYADLSGGNLSGADLRGANLTEARLRNVDFGGTGPVVKGENPDLAKTARANLSNANLTKADLTGAKLPWANLCETDMSEANLAGADLRGAMLYMVTLRGSQLRNADLSGAELIRANLSDAKLSGANLTGANLSEANLTDASLIDAKLVKATLRGARLSGSRLMEATLVSAGLDGARLTRADLSGANLANADLSNAKLRGADLSSANLNNANLSAADLSGVDLSGADLSDANLREANLRDSLMSRVIARGACCEDAKLLRFRTASCDFTGVQCRRADFSDYRDASPKWQEFGEGEFEKLYGPLFGVEVLLDPHVDFAVAAELMVWLKDRWQLAQPGSELTFDELRRQPQGYIGQFRVQQDLVETVKDCFAEQLRTLFDNQGRTPDETKVLLSQNLEGLERRLVRASVPASQLLAGKIGLTAVHEDRREPMIIEYYEAGAMKIGSVQGENVVIAEKLCGTGIFNLVQTARDKADVAAAVEQQLRRSQAVEEEDREALVSEFVASIPKDKLGFWKNALASLVASGAATGIGYYAQQLLHHLGK